MPPDQAQVAEARRLRAAIAQTLDEAGFCLPGSVTRREMRCGRPDCRCHDDPPRLHGPYWSWTRKVRAKTVTKLLSEEQLEDYTAWIDASRKVHELLRALEALSVGVVEADPRKRS